MFVLTVIKDEIRIHPSRFGAPVLDSLVEEIDGKYANQVSSSRVSGDVFRLLDEVMATRRWLARVVVMPVRRCFLASVFASASGISSTLERPEATQEMAMHLLPVSHAAAVPNLVQNEADSLAASPISPDGLSCAAQSPFA
jgi:hypothetical protein